MSVRLLLGDSLELLPSLEAGSVELVLADPPYGTTACKWDSVIPLDAMWRELRRVAKPNAAIVLFAAQPFTSALVMSNPREFRYDWVWDKGNPTGHLNAKKAPLKVHELVLVFSMQRHSYGPQMWTGQRPNGRRVKSAGVTYANSVTGRPLPSHENTPTLAKYPQSIIYFNKHPKHVRNHPSEKPVPLLAYLVRTYSNPGDLVLDFCMGSGSTGVACVQEGRDFVGIEKDAEYFRIAERRIATAQPPLPMAAD